MNGFDGGRQASLVVPALGFVLACSVASEFPTPVLPDPSPKDPPACPSGGSAVLATNDAPLAAITDYLNAGGDLVSLADRLYEQRWVSPESALVLTDLDADGIADLALGLAGTPGAEGIPVGTGIYLWRCLDGTYQPSEVLAGPPPPFSAPVLEAALDLTGDGQPELVASTPICGAHTCSAQYAILEWDGTSMVNRLRGPSDDLPSPKWSAQAAQPGQPSEVSIIAGGIGSAGAGPFRVVTRTWTWDPAEGAFVPRAEVAEPPRYRIHAVHDADDAFRRGDLPGSLALYDRAMNDDSLMDSTAPGGGRETLTAYAALRRVFVYLASDFPAAAEAEFESRLGSAQGPAVPYAELARLLLDRYPEVGLTQACAEARRQIDQDPAPVLSPLDYGYANRAYTSDDLCNVPPTP